MTHMNFRRAKRYASHGIAWLLWEIGIEVDPRTNGARGKITRNVKGSNLRTSAHRYAIRERTNTGQNHEVAGEVERDLEWTDAGV